MLFVITDEILDLSSGYELQISTSGCYFLDSNSDQQCSDLLVNLEKKRKMYSFNLSVKIGSLANHNQTQYCSTYLTIFLGDFFAPTALLDWNYVFETINFI